MPLNGPEIPFAKKLAVGAVKRYSVVKLWVNLGWIFGTISGAKKLLNSWVAIQKTLASFLAVF